MADQFCSNQIIGSLNRQVQLKFDRDDSLRRQMQRKFDRDEILSKLLFRKLALCAYLIAYKVGTHATIKS